MDARHGLRRSSVDCRKQYSNTREFWYWKDNVDLLQPYDHAAIEALVYERDSALSALMKAENYNMTNYTDSGIILHKDSCIRLLTIERDELLEALESLLREMHREMDLQDDSMRKYDVYHVSKGAVARARADLRHAVTSDGKENV